MDQEQIDELSQLTETVHDALRCGRWVSESRGWPVCRLVTLPSFENAVAWDVLSVPARREPAKTWLFRTCWRMDMDLQALGSPLERLKHDRPYQPTVEVDSTSIDASRIEGILRQLRTIPIPLAIARNHSGLDGTVFLLALGGPFCQSRIEWWERLPEEWAALGSVIDEMKELFETTWSNHGGIDEPG